MSKRPFQLLLVEDNPSDAKLVAAQVQTELDLELKTEETLEAAIRRLQKSKFDVVLLDLSLPDSHGLTSFKLLHVASQETPIIVLTGQEDQDMAVQALSEGAQDYLVKGKLDADSLVRSIRYTIERVRRQRAEAELRAAGAIQRRLFPAGTPKIPNFDIAGRCTPATYTGGDFFDFFSMGSQCLGVVIADVAGHGIGSAITMSQTRAIIRVFASLSSDVGVVLTQANAILARDLLEDAFVSLFLCRIDVATQSFQFASAGHPGFLLNAAGRTKQRLGSNSPPLGVNHATQYKASADIFFDKHDSLFLYTDGLQECVNPSREQFGKQRVFEAVRDNYELGSRALLDKLFETLKDFKREARRDDDITAVFVKAIIAETKPETDKPTTPEKKPNVAPEQYDAFEVVEQGVVTIVRILEDEILSSEKCSSVKIELKNFIEAYSPTAFVIDFHNVERFSSEAINMCLNIKSILDKKQSAMRLCGLHPHVREAFAVLNLDGPVFQIHETVLQAVDSF